MPPVFGPSSSSKARLKSCAGGSGTAVTPSQTASTDTSGPSSSSSTIRSSPRAERRRGRLQLGLRAADDDALARRQPVRLDDAGCHRCLQQARGRHAGRVHHVLGKRLRALYPGRGATRAEDRNAAVPQKIAEPVDQRRSGRSPRGRRRASRRARAAPRHRRSRRGGRCRARRSPGCRAPHGAR